MKKTVSFISALALTIGMTNAALADTVPTPVAQGADADTLAEMADQCDVLAAGYDTANGDIWTGVVTDGAGTLVAGPTEVGGTRVIDLGSIVGIGFHASQTQIIGDPFRNGGSVNMFGKQIATAGYYDDSTYNFDADFDSTFSYAFSCAVSQEVYHAPVLIPGHPVEGYYINNGTHPSGGEGSCQGLSPANPHWGNDLGNCTWVKTADAVDDSYTEESWDAPALVATLTGAVEQGQTDSLTAFEDHGGYYEVTGQIDLGNAVVCISPSTGTKKGVPGEWKQQNGYTGNKCTTTWFNTGATVGVTNLNLQGTFISVPPVS